MKILVAIRHPGQLRSLESVVELLSARGHDVHIAFGRIKTSDALATLTRLQAGGRRITFGKGPARTHPDWGSSGWGGIARRMRLGADYVRYLEPRFAEASALRNRARGNAPLAARRAAGVARIGGDRAVRALRRSLEIVDHCLPAPPDVERFVADHAPDVLVVTHMVEFGSAQTDYVRAAKRLGIPTAYLVFSWDNLTNKGLVHEQPDLVLVWNESQAREAVEVQDIPRDRVVVTGAPGFDHWFAWKPSRDREAFCRDVGLRADRPIVLYVCSSHFVARDEVAFVRRWAGALREHGGVLGDAGLLVRPHPRNAGQWREPVLEGPQLAVWPQLGEEPIDEGSRQNYFDSIYHSSAVVGINTSAQIESAIVRRPVHTVLADEFRETQTKTLHFSHLTSAEHGHVLVDRTLAEHAASLERSLRLGGSGSHDDRNERFVRHFVRPFGVEIAATPAVVDEIERLGRRDRSAPARGPLLAPLVRLALEPVVALSVARGRRRRRSAAGQRDELESLVRRLQRGEVQAPVVAGPWLGDGAGELLYWVPFLQWCEATSVGLSDRLAVVCSERNAAWYAELGGRRLAVDQLEPGPDGASSEDRLWSSAIDAVGADALRSIRAELVRARRSVLAKRHPGERFSRRFLEFRPLTVPALPGGLELPPAFFVAGFAFGDAYPDTDEDIRLASAALAAAADLCPVVVLDLPAELEASVESLVGAHPVQPVCTAGDRDVAAAVIGRAEGFFGSYGPLPYAAALLGVSAVAFFVGGTVPASDLRLAGAFLGRVPFGTFRGIEIGAPVQDLVAEALSSFETPTVSGVGLTATR